MNVCERIRTQYDTYSRNPYQAETDWHGLYPADASADAILFPKVRRAAVQEHPALFEMDAEEVTDSTCHPAKMSLPLLRRILGQMRAWGWLAPGGCVVDPFGGRGSTAAVWTAQDPRNRAVTVELEPHFVAMQQQVKDAAERRLGRKLAWTILQGDSRRVDALLDEAGVGVTSPPWAEVVASADPRFITPGEREKRVWSKSNATDYGATPGQIANLPDPVSILSPPYGQGTIARCDVAKLQALTQDPSSSLYGRNPNGSFFQAHAAGYVNSEGNIDNLPDDPACVMSPPYEGSLASDDPDKRGGLFRDPKRRTDRTLTGTYEAVGVTSPPYEAQSGGHPIAESGVLADPRLHERHAASKIHEQTGYADNESGQIGATQGETYADACGAVYAALARAGVRYLAVVTKNPTRAGKLRRLDHLTVRLLRQAGYRVVAWRRCWLFMGAAEVDALHGQSALLDGGRSRKVHGRLSFFKRLSVAKGSPAAQWEDLYFCELADGGAGVSVTSPPYEDSINATSHGIDWTKAGAATGNRRRGDGCKQGETFTAHLAYAESPTRPTPPSPWLTPHCAHAADPQPGAQITFLGQDGARLAATVTARRGDRFSCEVECKGQRYPLDFAGDWPAGLTVVGAAVAGGVS